MLSGSSFHDVFNCAQGYPWAKSSVENMVNTLRAPSARSQWAPLLLAGLVLFLSNSPLLAQEARPHYRSFVLGSALSSVSAQVKAAASDATVVHARPALMQDLKWRLPYFVDGSSQPQTDTVEQIVFSFYNDQLFKLAIDYDRQRTAGMTAADMAAALSETYGSGGEGQAAGDFGLRVGGGRRSRRAALHMGDQRVLGRALSIDVR